MCSRSFFFSFLICILLSLFLKGSKTRISFHSYRTDLMSIINYSIYTKTNVKFINKNDIVAYN